MNVQKMMKKAQQVQEDLAAKTVEVSVGGGKLTVTANCAGEIVGLKIAKEVVDPEDVEMLEDLVLSGVKQALAKGRDVANTEMSRLTAGLGLPPGFGF